MLKSKGLIALAAVLGLGAIPVAVAKPAASASAARTTPLTIISGKRKFAFRVEVARTGAEQARGLMFRKSLGPDQGMIFPMNPPRFASFWMKNTLIPLDMIFIRRDGTIVNIAARTVPQSLEPMESFEPVGAVLEVAGGRTAALGIKPGDRVSWAGQ